MYSLLRSNAEAVPPASSVQNDKKKRFFEDD